MDVGDARLALRMIVAGVIIATAVLVGAIVLGVAVRIFLLAAWG